MKKNNAGFSLLEVIVVVAMLAILTGVGVYGIGQLTGFRARETADEITSSLSKNKIETLGKAKSSGGMAWEIYRDGKYTYVRTVYDAGTGSEYYSNSEEVNKNNIKINIGLRRYNNDHTASATSWQELNDGEAFRIYFNRSTGALCTASGGVMDRNPIIQIKYGRKQYEVEVVSKTGKVISNSRR